jgi:Fis family transcriptional regulator
MMSPATDSAAVLEVGSESSNKPLRECIASALQNYFHHLDGHKPDNLYQMVLAEMEAPLLKAVLDYTGGNQSHAATMLGINRGTLRKKLRQYDLD